MMPDSHRAPRRRRFRLRSQARTRLVILGGIVAVVLSAAGLSIALGGFPAATTAPSGSLTDAFAGAEVGPSLVAVAAPSAPLPAMSQVAAATPAASPPRVPPAGVVASRIRVARLGIDLPIVEGDGVDAPLGRAAHYPGTGWPGGGTNIYLYGHARDGMLLPLWNVALGDAIVLDLVDGTRRTYIVSEILPKAPWDAMYLLAPTPTEQLTLQTCTSYEQTAPRFIVIAVPAS